VATKQKVIIDTDPGVDDAMAILYALASDELEVLGLTIVHGNSGDLVQTGKNAVHILELAGRSDIPVFIGARKALMFPHSEGALFVHGQNALGGVPYSAPKGSVRTDLTAAEFMIRTCVHRYPKEVAIIALGPLTNLGAALGASDQLSANVAFVSVMGGAFNTAGNISALAEANTFNDPHAAQMVFNAPWRVLLAPLNVTHTAILKRDFFVELGKRAPTIGKFLDDISVFYFDFHLKSMGELIIHAHDVMAVAAVVAPHLFTERKVSHVDVDTSSGATRGLCIADFRQSTETAHAAGASANVEILLAIDVEGLKMSFAERIAKLDKAK
jgi:purine nucleosidase